MITLYNADSYQKIKEIPDKSIDLIYTDPPYLYTSGYGERLKEAKQIKADYVSEINNGISDTNILEEFVRILKHIYIYIWCNDKQIYQYLQFFVGKYDCDYKILVWAKTNPMPMYSRRYMDDIEYCILFRDKKAKFSGVDTYENSFKAYKMPINAKDKKLFDHPTIKPLEVVKYHIQKSTSEEMTIFDPFMGSGTTGVACKCLNRNFIGIEIDEKYFKIAEKRILDTSYQLNMFDFGGKKNDE